MKQTELRVLIPGADGDDALVDNIVAAAMELGSDAGVDVMVTGETSEA